MTKQAEICCVATAVLAIVTAIVYAFADAKDNSAITIGLLIACGVLEIVRVAVPKIPYLEYLPFAAVLVSVGVFIDLAFDEGYDILSKMNVDGLSNSYIVSAVLLGLTMIAAAVVTVLATSTAAAPPAAAAVSATPASDTKE